MRGPAASSQVACWVLTPINFWNRLELISSSVADRLKVIFNIKDWWNFFQCLGLVDSKGLNIFNTFLYFFQGLVDSKGQSLDDEYMEDNYGAPLNMVCRQFSIFDIFCRFKKYLSRFASLTGMWRDTARRTMCPSSSSTSPTSSSSSPSRLFSSTESLSSKVNDVYRGIFIVLHSFEMSIISFMQRKFQQARMSITEANRQSISFQ